MSAQAGAGEPLRERARVPHVLFGVALLLLALVAAWWFVFLQRSARVEQELRAQVLALEARSHVQRLVAGGRPVPRGPVPGDARFVVVDADGATASRALATGPGFHVELGPEVAVAEDARLSRRHAMIVGEGTFLLLLVATCVVMLYRLVLAERRYRRDIDAFMGRVTHEMKTPLAGLRALLQTIRDGRVPPDRLSELATLGLRQAEREEHLVENLLIAHRMRTRAAAPRIEELDLAGELAAFARHRVQSMGLDESAVQVRCEPGLSVRGDARALRTILENLADNAFKYGASAVRLEARSSQGGAAGGSTGSVVLRVEDDGGGFDPAAAEALFTPFERQREATLGGAHGTGLGLPIARALAVEMGGTLTGRSDGPGRGACFDLTLRGGDGAARGPDAPPQARAADHGGARA